MRPYTDSKDAFARGCRRALDEGRIVANMGYVSNVVQVYDAFPENGTVYIVMEYIDGATLSQLVKGSGPMNWRYAYSLPRPIMAALRQIHAKGVIHRDISPDNIMQRRANGEMVLLDFGAAHPFQEGQAGDTQSLRPGYAPVEQYSTTSAQDARTDEYAMCATFYYLITGITPKGADQLLLSDQSLQSPRSLDVNIPESVEAVLLKGMSLRLYWLPSRRLAVGCCLEIAIRGAHLSPKRRRRRRRKCRWRNPQRNLRKMLPKCRQQRLL